MSECCNQFIMEEYVDEFEMTEALKGDPGPGVAPGGTTGQILAKASDEDYDTEWIDQPELDAGHVEYDPAETYDDGSVGKELSEINSALSSLESVTEIIDTASGAIASFPDGSGLPMRSLVAEINPVQAGTGDPSPDNIRPITGHTGLSVFCEEQYDQSASPKATVSWQDEAGTVYGGTLDVVSGLLTVTHKVWTENGSANWARNTDGSFYTVNSTATDASTSSSDGFCNYMRYAYSASTTFLHVWMRQINGGMVNILGGDVANVFPDVATLKSAFASTPLLVAYPLATPITYQLTPQQISTLYGQNNVWHDANGDTTVTYQANLKGYIDKKLA